MASLKGNQWGTYVSYVVGGLVERQTISSLNILSPNIHQISIHLSISWQLVYLHDLFIQWAYLNYLFIYTKQQLTLEKTEGAIKNGQSRDIGNIGRTRHRKINKPQYQNTQIKTQHRKLKRWTTQTTPKHGDEPSCSLRVSGSCLL